MRCFFPGLVATCLVALSGGRAAAQPRFLEVADAVGVRHQLVQRLAPNAAGVAFLDVDGDGRQDLLFVDDAGPCRLYRNEPAAGEPALDEPPFRLRDVTDASRIGALCRGTALAIIDYDRDGQDDVLVAGYDGVRLLRNEGGVFTDRSAEAGFGGELGAATLSVADIDRDGYPDVYVGRYVTRARFPVHACGANRLYRNRGDGTFEEVARALGADDRGCALATAFVDLQDTGALDLVVANDFGNTVAPSDILRWDGARYVSAGRALGADLRIYAMGVALGDFEGDGWLDLYTTNIGRNVLLRGGPSGFADMTEARGVGLATLSEAGRTRFRASWGTAAADFDLDGALELYVVSGYLSAESAIQAARRQPNVLFAGGPGGALSPVPDAAADPGVGRGLALGDLDGDGVPDLVVSNLPQTGAEPALAVPLVYWSRPPLGRGALSLTLVGTVSEPRAGGARVTLHAGGRAQVRIVDSGGASHGSHHARAVHFGLGGVPLAERVVVRWPSGVTSEHGPFPAGARATLIEPRFFEVPPQATTGALVSLAATPLDARGHPVGAGRRVRVSVTCGALEGPVSADAGGRYVQAWRAPSEPADCRASFSVDEVTHPARPRLRVRGAAHTGVGLPDAPLRAGEEVSAYVRPLGADGAALGPRRSVTLLASAGQVGATTDLGDGAYRVRVRAPVAPGTITLRPVVDGQVVGPGSVFDVVAAFDPVASRVEATYSVMGLGYGGLAVVRAEPLDGAGRPVAALADIAFTTEAGQLSGPLQAYQQGFVTQTLWLPGEPSPDRFAVQATYRGVPFARAAVVRRALDGAVVPPEHIDGPASRVLAFHSALPADGRSSVRVFLALRDVNGGTLPASAGTVFHASGGRWRGPATAAIGQVATRCLVAPTTPGMVEVSARVSGVEVGQPVQVYFHPETPLQVTVDGCGDEGLDPIPEVAPTDGGRAGGGGDGGADGGAEGGADGGTDAGLAAVDAGGLRPADGGASAPDAGTSAVVPAGGCAAGPGAASGLAALLVALAALLRRGRARRARAAQPSSRMAQFRSRR